MYQTYLWKIKPVSSYLTPWQSDTIYGHLLWAISLLYGDEEIKNTLNDFENNKSPFIISDGFIDGKLPMIKKQVIKRETNQKFAELLNLNLVEVIKRRKVINKISSITLEEFNRLRENYSNEEFMFDKLKEDLSKGSLSKDKIFTQTTVMHNVINRYTGSTTDNSLFFSKEFFTTKDIHIFIKLREDYSIKKFETLLKFVEDNGYGKKVSTGKGEFKTISFEKFNGFNKIENADGFIVLSNYIPKNFDYKEVISENPLIKFGKTANFGENADIPFKKPFACFAAGSLFKNGENKNIGKILKNIHYDDKIVQIGIPFTLEVKL